MYENIAVSVCLPVFNGAKYLEQAINCVLNQDFQNFELLISDDGSTDDSWSIVERYAKQDARISAWKTSKQLGLFGNYNECLRRAKGNYIKPFAQDDLLEKNCLSRMIQIFNDNGDVSLVTSARNVIDAQGNPLSLERQFANDIKLTANEAIKGNLATFVNWIGEPCTVMFRKASSDQGFDENYRLYGDVEYWFRVLGRSNLYYISDALSSFRRHLGSESFRALEDLTFWTDILMLASTYGNELADSNGQPTSLNELVYRKGLFWVSKIRKFQLRCDYNSIETAADAKSWRLDLSPDKLLKMLRLCTISFIRCSIELAEAKEQAASEKTALEEELKQAREEVRLLRQNELALQKQLDDSKQSLHAAQSRISYRAASRVADVLLRIRLLKKLFSHTNTMSDAGRENDRSAN